MLARRKVKAGSTSIRELQVKSTPPFDIDTPTHMVVQSMKADYSPILYVQTLKVHVLISGEIMVLNYS